jgi:hypothetical protein
MTPMKISTNGIQINIEDLGSLGSMALSSSRHSESLSEAGSSGEKDACGWPFCGFPPYRLVQSVTGLRAECIEAIGCHSSIGSLPPRPD